MQQDTDQIHRFILDTTDIRGEIVTLEKSFLDATAHQDLPKGCKALLGEFLAAVSLLSETLKYDGLLTLQARGDGDIPLIMAETDNLGHIRGIVKQGDNAPPLEGMPTLKEAIGNGVLVLTVDPKSGERYQGIVPLEKDDLAGCLSDYFERSEQLNTQFSLFSSDDKCAGLLLQALPPKEQKDEQERAETWSMAAQFAETLKADEIFTLDHNTILFRLFNELECRVFTGKTVQFKCTCSRKRSANAIGSLGVNDARTLLAEEKIITINCDFCGTQYQYTQEDLPDIFGEDGHPVH